MAITIETQDLDFYPGVVKRVTIDQDSVVPMNNEGDEAYLLTFSTSHYSDNTARTAIQDYYVTNFKTGWCRSSGFAGSSFALDATHCSLEIKIDTTVSGVTVSGVRDGYYRITLDHNSGVPIDGDVVAADMEEKIRAITLNTADVGYSLAYKNASVDFIGGTFWIVSGSLSQYYTGANRSSVKVRASDTNDCSSILGFDLQSNSEDLSGSTAKEATLASDYTTTSGSDTITISSDIGASAGDCFMITDRTNTDYFQATSASGTSITFNGALVSNNYTASVTKVQLLREQDPDADPYLWLNTVDKITRHGVKVIMSQIDYSS